MSLREKRVTLTGFAMGLAGVLILQGPDQNMWLPPVSMLTVIIGIAVLARGVALEFSGGSQVFVTAACITLFALAAVAPAWRNVIMSGWRSEIESVVAIVLIAILGLIIGLVIGLVVWLASHPDRPRRTKPPFKGSP
jgi:hypothetical protein